MTPDRERAAVEALRAVIAAVPSHERTVHAIARAVIAAGWVPQSEVAERVTCALTPHADPEEYARIYNEGYDAAYAQELAGDPSAADEWLEAHDRTTRRSAADTVLAEARRLADEHHVASTEHGRIMALGERLAAAVLRKMRDEARDA